MASVILKDSSVSLRRAAGGFYTLKGNYEINVISEELLKELIDVNPELKEWIDNGYAVINAKNDDNVKADGHLEAVKAEEKRSEEALKEAKETIKKASRKKGQ